MEILSMYNWKPLKLISGNNISKVYKAEKDDGTIGVVKKITLPIKDSDAARLMERGKILFLQDATNYYVEQMNNEINTLNKLVDEKNILHIYDTFQEQQDGKSSYYIVMEYADDITTHFKKNGVSESDVIKLGIDICNALESCEKHNILHNDIKPTNIFYNGTDYKLGDFGNSTIGGNDNIVLFGSPNYMSPEVYNQKLTTEASDLYSLGIVMYHLLSGNVPFVDDKTPEKKALEQRMSGAEIPQIEGITPKLMEVVLKACNYNEFSRYRSVADMKHDLEVIATVSTIKKQIFFNNSKLNDTISVFDNDLISSQGKIGNEIIIQKKKTKRKVFLKKWGKRLSTAVLLLLLFIGCFVIYSLNKECELGFINKNGICVKGYYYCDTGYVLNESNQCQKTIKSKDAKVSYSCPSGFTYTKETCVSNDVVEPTFVYQCLDGFTLNGKKCVKIETNDAVVTYSCPKGYANMNGVCVKGEEKDAKVTYSCPSGYTTGPFEENGVYKCSKYVSSASTIDATLSYVCPDGYTNGPFEENGVQKCSKSSSTTTTTNATANYSCSTGTLNSNNKCVTSESNVSSSSCTSKGGVTSNEQCKYNYSWCSYTPYSYGCVKTCTYTCTITTDAKITYSCPNGGTLSGTKCKNTSGTTNKVNATKKYTCPEGYTKKDTKCSISGGNTIKTSAEATYTCPKGYTRVGSKCIDGTKKNGTPVYNCLDSQKLVGTKCETTITTDAVGMYTCPDGFVASGITCIQEEFPQPLAKYSCSRVYTLNGAKCEQYETKPAKAVYTD